MGKHLPVTNPTVHATRLKSDDYRSRQTFQRRVVIKYCNQQKIKEKAALARRERESKKGTTGTTYLQFMTTFNPKNDAFHIKTRNIKTMAAADIRKIYAGGQDFSQKTQSFKDIIEFWRQIVKRKQGVIPSRTALQATAKRVKISLQFQKILTIAQAGAKLTLEY